MQIDKCVHLNAFYVLSFELNWFGWDCVPVCCESTYKKKTSKKFGFAGSFMIVHHNTYIYDRI